jgi:hypothetical protein
MAERTRSSVDVESLEASPDGGGRPRFGAMLHRLVWQKSFAFSIRSLSPLSYMGLKLACIVQRFLHGSTIPDYGAFCRWCRRVFPSLLAAVEPVCPYTALWFLVGESLEERDSSDDVEYR